METINCPYTEEEAVEQIIDLILKYQNVPSWEIGIREDGEIDAITDDSHRGFGIHYIVMRYFYSTTDDPIDIPTGDRGARETFIELFQNNWAPESQNYKIKFKDEND